MTASVSAGTRLFHRLSSPPPFTQLLLLLPLLLLLCQQQIVSSQSAAFTASQQVCVQQCMSTGVNCSSGCGIPWECSAGWNGLLYKRCYMIHYPTTPGFNFSYAQSQCQQQNGSQLVAVHNQTENSFLYGLIVNTPNPDGLHHSFWLGMRLSTASSSGLVTEAWWSDGSPMDYGSPLVSANVGKYPWAVGQPVQSTSSVNYNCARMFGFGPYLGQWYNADCNQATNLVPTIGYFCKGCPAGWTMFNGRCYKAFIDQSQVGMFVQFQRLCSLFNATVVSIHSAAENDFVLNLAKNEDPTVGGIFIGLTNKNTWVDGSPFNFGNVAPGVYPWADTGVGYPNQPDNVPWPGDCTMMWVDAAVPGNKEPGRWDDITCGMSPMSGTVCKF